ncbi:MAG TPA: class I adenylate-forming enzyme family protein [Thermoanaerobaculia bacterium]|nr:class I adenylate-forming enzyme family protein [Thermoanaerobaculia bacterium]
MTPQDPILRAFERIVRHDPLAPLVVSPERRATAGDVDALARAAGAVLMEGTLTESALAPGTVVGLAAANGPGFLASVVALRRAGLAVLLLDARTPDSEALRILGSLGAPALLRCPGGWPAGPQDWTFTALETVAAVPAPPTTGFIKLTSGSTGKPRGIATPSEALMADDDALAASMGLRSTDRFLATIPLSHSYGLSSLAVPALVRGTLLAMPEELSVYDPFVTAARLGTTFYPAVPAYLDALVRMSDPPPRPDCLRLVITAGAPLAATTSARFRERFGLPIHVFYGSSECGGICYDREGGAAERGTVGSPIEGVRILLEPVEGNGEATGASCCEGLGIVTVESPAVSLGYLPEPDERLGSGRFRAGDVASWRNGELVLRGRLDDVVNIKGKKVDPREVEGVLAQLAGVDEAAVLGVSCAGRSGELLRAVVACRPGHLTAEDVVAWCRSHLSAHKVPRSVILVETLPRNARGKLDRSALVALGIESRD